MFLFKLNQFLQGFIFINYTYFISLFSHIYIFIENNIKDNTQLACLYKEKCCCRQIYFAISYIDHTLNKHKHHYCVKGEKLFN